MDLRRPRLLPWMHDLVLLTATGVATAMFVWNGRIAVTQPADRPPPWWVVLVVAAGVAPLLVRRTRPITAFLGCTVAVSLLAVLDAPIGVPLASGVALFAVAAQRTAAMRPARIAGLVALGLVGYVGACAASIEAAPWSELLHTALLWSACWLAGERARLQSEQFEELRREAARDRALATAEERMRIARDLHDTAGHAINVIAVHAGAARLRYGEDPERTLRALSTIEDLARRTVAEIDDMLGTWRATDASPETTPASLASLPVLLRQHRESGHLVDLRVSGGERPLPAAVDQAAYRIVQEGLTNASRHGSGPARVELDFRPDRLALTITNPAGRPATAARTGHGLIGVHERASALGGQAETSLDAGRFALRVLLPIAGVPTDAGTGTPR